MPQDFPTEVQCRARVSDRCMDGRPLEESPYESGTPKATAFAYANDGSFDSRDGTVICDACYVTIGMPSFPTRDRRARVDHMNMVLSQYRERMRMAST